MRESLTTVPDDDLLRRASELVHQGRGVDADLVAHIGEIEMRRLYAREAASSMFDYCRQVLGLRENEAYLRITVARASREHPVLLEMLRDGRLHLSGIGRLAPHLTRANRETILNRAAGMSHRQVREFVSELEPKPEISPTIRKLPDRSAPRSVAPAQLGAPRVASCALNIDPVSALLGPLGLSEDPPAPASAPTRSAVIEPVGPSRFRVRFDVDAELRDKFERLQALMRSSVPDGDLVRLIDIAVTEKLERIEAKRFAKTKAPRKNVAQTDMSPKSRHIPAAVRRIVHERDRGQCAYRDKRGRRCSKRHDLEFHHKEPFGRGGDHSPGNLTLMCRAHNTFLAEHDYGKEVMARFRASASGSSAPVDVYGSPIAVRPRWRSPG